MLVSQLQVAPLLVALPLSAQKQVESPPVY